MSDDVLRCVECEHCVCDCSGYCTPSECHNRQGCDE